MDSETAQKILTDAEMEDLPAASQPAEGQQQQQQQQQEEEKRELPPPPTNTKPSNMPGVGTRMVMPKFDEETKKKLEEERNREHQGARQRQQEQHQSMQGTAPAQTNYAQPRREDGKFAPAPASAPRGPSLQSPAPVGVAAPQQQQQQEYAIPVHIQRQLEEQGQYIAQQKAKERAVLENDAATLLEELGGAPISDTTKRNMAAEIQTALDTNRPDAIYTIRKFADEVVGVARKREEEMQQHKRQAEEAQREAEAAKRRWEKAKGALVGMAQNNNAQGNAAREFVNTHMSEGSGSQVPVQAPASGSVVPTATATIAVNENPVHPTQPTSVDQVADFQQKMAQKQQQQQYQAQFAHDAPPRLVESIVDENAARERGGWIPKAPGVSYDIPVYPLPAGQGWWELNRNKMPTDIRPVPGKMDRAAWTPYHDPQYQQKIHSQSHGASLQNSSMAAQFASTTASGGPSVAHTSLQAANIPFLQQHVR